MTPKLVKLTRVNLELDARRLEDIADWIDQTVGHGSDQAAQLRTVASTVQSLAFAWGERKRRTKAP